MRKESRRNHDVTHERFSNINSKSAERNQCKDRNKLFKTICLIRHFIQRLDYRCSRSKISPDTFYETYKAIRGQQKQKKRSYPDHCILQIRIYIISQEKQRGKCASKGNIYMQY